MKCLGLVVLWTGKYNKGVVRKRYIKGSIQPQSSIQQQKRPDKDSKADAYLHEAEPDLNETISEDRGSAATRQP